MRPVITTLLILGFAFAAITGAGQYLKNRLEWRREKIRQEQNAALGFDPDGTLNEIKTKMILSGVLTAAGCLGLFLFIYRATRNNQPLTIKDLYKKQNQS